MDRHRMIADRFELVSVVGSGAMGVVHRGVDRRTGEAVAVKLLRSGVRDHLARFERETSILSELTHPGIVRYLEHGTTDEGEPYLVMEWLEGEDLARRLKREGISVEGAVALARRAAEALAVAHARGIVHRDLKPSNLFLVDGRTDALKVIDFGVAQLDFGLRGATEALTQTGVVVGTPGYMAPEQIRGRRGVDARADVFALGCILFRCLTGEKPFPGEDVMGVLMRTVLEEAPRIRSLRPEVPVSLDVLVQEMLSKDPEKRPQDAAAVIARIDALASPPRQGAEATRAERRPGNLRPSPTSFLGREGELQRLHEQLADGRWLVTLHGPGGTGKTRLAMRYGELHAERGVWFCDLTEARTASGVCGAVASALDVLLDTEQTSADVVARLARELAARGTALVIVDNCEQVVEHVASVLPAWHDAAPHVQFLATSREVLRVRGECVHELGPLALPGEGEDVASAEAVRLFVDRARMVRQGYVLGEAEAPVVADIARQLDGLPLAIELAAARMGALGAQTILDRLQRRFDLLAGGARDAAVRQRTLHDTIDWSWRLLETWEQAALAQCAVFRGGFTLEAAEAVIDVSAFVGAPPVLDIVQALHDKSLLRSEQPQAGTRRFGMYESIRAFAEEKLDASDWGATAHHRHASHYLKEADSIVHAYEMRDFKCIHRLAIDLENLTAVHRRAVSEPVAERPSDALRAMLALDAILNERGPRDVNVALLEATLEGPGTDPSLLARVTLARARLTRGLESLGVAAEGALEVARSEEDVWLEATAQMWLGNFHAWHGRHPAASAQFASARQRFADGGYDSWEATMIVKLAAVASEAGRDAGAHFQEALDAFRRLGDQGGVGLALFEMAHGLHDAGRFDESHATFAEMLPLSGHLPTRSRAMAFGYMATLHHERGELEEAQEWYERALTHASVTGGGDVEQLFLAALGALLASLDKVIEAERAFGRATELHGSDVHAGVLRLHRGHLDLARARASTAGGDVQAAARHREQAERRLREDGGDTTDDLRFATRMLRRALDPSRAELPTFVVAPDGRWFKARREKKVEIGRRPQLERLLRALVRQRLDAPGDPMSVDALLRVAWPGERFAVERSGAMRVYVQVSRLRKLGLRDVLRSVGDGYLLDPSVVVAKAGGSVPSSQ